MTAGINTESRFVAGVERFRDTGPNVSDNGEAVHIESGDAGSNALSWVMYRMLMGGEQPGVVSADVNLCEMSNGELSSYFVGLSNYSDGVWEWFGPFVDSHVRLSTGASVSAGADFLSELGNQFVVIAAFDGAVFDVVGVGTNARDATDTEAPPEPTGLTAVPVFGGLDLQWNGVIAGDLAGYRIYYSDAGFTTGADAGVRCVDYLAGQTSHMLSGLPVETMVRVSAVDISGNESMLSDDARETPLAGSGPELRLTVTASSGLVNDEISLTASGALSYCWDLDGDGFFEITGDASGTQPADTGRAGIARPSVRGTTDDGSCVSCAAVSLLLCVNSRPVANAYATPTVGQAPLPVLLTGEGEDDDGVIASYSWDFDGDGIFDELYDTNPGEVLHMYNAAGLYNAKFRVEDDLRSWDVDTVAVLATLLPPSGNTAPIAVLAVGEGEENGEAPRTVHFDASASVDPDEGDGDSIVRYWWDPEGDGIFDTSTTTPYFDHIYEYGGVFSPGVMAVDSYSANGTDCIDISVGQTGNLAPTADLVIDPAYADEGDSVTLDASGSFDHDGSITTYEWDFDGDGLYDSTGSYPITTHTYDTYGIYAVTVRITDDGFAQDTTTACVRINESFTPGIAWPSFRHDQRHTGRSPYPGPQDCNFMWSFSAGHSLKAGCAIAGDGTVYVASLDHKLYAINPDGTEKWSFEMGDVSVCVPAIAPDGTVYVGCRDNLLYALSSAGALQWTYTTGGNVDSAPVVTEVGMIYVGSGDGKLHVINPDGTLNWTYTTASGIYPSPAIAPDGTVYFGSTDHRVYAVNPDASLKWSYNTGSIVYSSPAIDVDGTVYVGSDNGKLYAFNPDGSIKWFYEAGGFVRSSPAIGADGTIYVGCRNHEFYAINRDGSFKWSFTTGEKVGSSPVISSDGSIYVGSIDGKLYAFDPDGTELWSYFTGGFVEASPAISADGTVYIGSWNSKLHAIGLTSPNIPPEAVLAASPVVGVVPVEVIFDASGSSDSDGSIVGYEWDFDGDGVYDLQGSSSVNHTYDTAATYYPKVRVTDNDGGTDVAAIEVKAVVAGTWVPEEVDIGGTVGRYSSVAIVDGHPAISYFATTGLDLRYVRANDPNGATWGIPVTVDAANWTGHYTSLAVVDGRPAISYYEDAGNDLLYVRATDSLGSTWGTPVVIDDDWTGQFTTLLVVDGNPAISFYDPVTDDLMYVRATDASGDFWGTAITVDVGGNVGAYSSMVIVDGNPAISYYDLTNTDLNYIRALDATGSTWGASVAIDTTGAVGKYTSLAVVDGYPAISYYDESNLDMKFVRATDATGTAWGTPLSLDTADEVGMYTSLAVVNGYPAISYYDSTNGDLKYLNGADASGSTWATPLVVDSTGDVGHYTCLIEVNGCPGVSYFDVTYGDLMFARLYN